MKRLIETIRGVVGVSGVILLEKHSGVFHKLLPARLDSANQDRLCERLSVLANIDIDYGKAIARFKKGWIFVYNYDAFAILVLGKHDLNTTTLNLVLKSAVSSLETTFSQRRMTGDANFEFHAEHAILLTRAVNLSVAFFQSQFNRFEIAEILRQAKAQLLTECPALKNFTVDANGGIILIKGADKNMDESSIEAAARLVLTFVDIAKAKASIIGFDVEKMTAQIHPRLTDMGFYRWFQSSRKSRAR